MTLAPPLEIGVQPGHVIAGKYRVERVLGASGASIVVAAYHTVLDERVALKLLRPEVLTSRAAVDRFAGAVRRAAGIRSQHVARVLDVGALENGSPYVVMEHLEGSDLRVLLASYGPPPLAQMVGYIREACEALSEAHALGLVHRDVKPQNLFLANRLHAPPIIKVLDFGMSPSTFAASPFYWAPEVMQSSLTVDVRSDVWSLGVTMFELLTGMLPFGGDTLPELVLAVVQRAPVPLHTRRSDLPPGFEAIITRCLAKDPAARFQSIGELTAALAPFGPSPR